MRSVLNDLLVCEVDGGKLHIRPCGTGGYEVAAEITGYCPYVDQYQCCFKSITSCKRHITRLLGYRPKWTAN